MVHFVTGPMVGDRRFPGATILGASFSTSSANHPLSVPPTHPELRDAWWTVYKMSGPVRSDGFSSLGAMCLYGAAASLSPAVAAAAVLGVSTLRRPWFCLLRQQKFMSVQTLRCRRVFLPVVQDKRCSKTAPSQRTMVRAIFTLRAGGIALNYSGNEGYVCGDTGATEFSVVCR